MTNDQCKAISSLKRALKKCGNSGLQGGVYDGSFCVWPKEKSPATSGESDSDFFNEVEKYGESFNVDEMPLDGGAGV